MITQAQYTALQQAYDFFNRALFAGQLPPCLITLQRRRNAYGYYAHERFIGRGHNRNKTDEIALNPALFDGDPDKEIWSTLVHEQVHLWQAHFDKPSRGNYHNKRWAKKMKDVGLYPSTTGKPGGKETGDPCSHYIIEGGPFDQAADRLPQEIRVDWQALDYHSAQGEEEDEGGKAKKPPESKLKYSCPVCAANVWGKTGLKLLCINTEGCTQKKAVFQSG